MAPNTKRVFYVKYLPSAVYSTLLAKRPDLLRAGCSLLAPTKSNRGLLVANHACRRCRLRCFGCCGLGLMRRRRGNRIGEDGLCHRKYSGKKNDRKGGAEHGKSSLRADRWKQNNESDAPSL